MKKLFKFIPLLIFVSFFGVAVVHAQYCTPSYQYGCQYGDGLTLFQLNTINQTISCPGNTTYHDFTALSTPLVIGTPYTITVQAGYLLTCLTVWIDYNHNNTFDNATEAVGHVTCTVAFTNYTITFTIPNTALTGSTRLRALTEYNTYYPNYPCGSYYDGNCSDFTVNIVNPPTVTTLAATSISSVGATLNGNINANGSSTTVTFQYGLTNAYGTTVTGVPNPVTGSIVTADSAALTSLTQNTVYHYRVVGVNAGGTSYGSDQTFTTPFPILPSTIPTLSQWGLIILSFLLLVLGTVFILRRQNSFAIVRRKK